jgi:transcriptional regulator with XRE-family HTH domain
MPIPERKERLTGEQIATLRRSYGLSQAQFAALVGVNRISVSHWERDRFRAPYDLVDRLAEAKLSTVGVVTAADHVEARRAQAKAHQFAMDTAAAYREMRRQGRPHAFIIGMWQREGFTPSQEAQDLILAEFPDILSNPKD